MHGKLAIPALLVALMFAAEASADSIAVFGDNGVDNFLSANGHTVTLVTDAQLATPGFLDSFDVFFYTRDGSSFGDGLSAGAAAQVILWANGNAVALAGDFADSIPGDPTIGQLVLNSVDFAGQFGHGFVGEFNGAASAMTTNSNGFNALGIFTGNAGPLGGGEGGSSLAVVADAANGGHPVLGGLGLPYDPPDVEFGTLITGANSSQVIARWGSTTGNPAILAKTGRSVPEPTLVILLATGALGLRLRRRLLAA